VRAPFAAVWGAVDNDQRLWIYREIYASGVYAEQQAEAILEAERNARETEVIRVADPSMWGDRGTPLSVADVYGQAGCGIMKANNDRINGWARVHAYLNPGSACAIHSEKGWDVCPMLHVFEETCPMFIETIPTLPRSKIKPDDAETKNVEDHIPDALRYMCMEVGTFASPILYSDHLASEQTGAPIQADVYEDYTGNDEEVPLLLVCLQGIWESKPTWRKTKCPLRVCSKILKSLSMSSALPSLRLTFPVTVLVSRQVSLWVVPARKTRVRLR
jgi:hypothetical protein